LVGWGLFSRHDISGTLDLIAQAPDKLGGAQADRVDALFAESTRHFESSGKDGPYLLGFHPTRCVYQVDH
jgi:hypothetical protein